SARHLHLLFCFHMTVKIAFIRYVPVNVIIHPRTASSFRKFIFIKKAKAPLFLESGHMQILATRLGKTKYKRDDYASNPNQSPMPSQIAHAVACLAMRFYSTILLASY
ncbi:unnamed protein product, partial [Sphacelaria rigidula]